MASGRNDDSQRRRRRGATPSARRSGRARRDEPREAREVGISRQARASRTPGKRPGGKASTRPRPRSSTGGAFKLSSTRRASVLALLVCALALSVSVPLRTYLSQRDELAAQRQQQTDLARQVRELDQRRAQLSDPAQVEAEARKRLGYVRPGETPYIVQLPSPPAAAPPGETSGLQPAPQPPDLPWYQQLWTSIAGKGPGR